MVLRAGVYLSLCLTAVLPSFVAAQAPPATAGDRPAASELAGVWEAKLRFGPDIRGQLTIESTGARWRAEIAGHGAEARLANDTIVFELPDGRGGFRGQFVSKRERIVGHWIQPATATNGTRYASPATLSRIGKTERWRGAIDPIDDEFRMYLKVVPVADGTMHAFLRNPERNIGFITRVAALERDGQVIRLLAAAKKPDPARVLAEGVYRDDVMSIPLRGGTYDFRRVSDDAVSDFYARARAGVGSEYRYRMPASNDDGWPVATPEEVGMSRAALEGLVRSIIDAPIDSVGVLEIHSVLIARHGKLVLEEYFHGEHRDKPHDTRSAAKVLASVLLGAAIHAGAPLSAQSHVYQVMNAGTFASLEPRKQSLTLEHLLTMSSGLDADDSDDNSPGREDFVVDEGHEPDYWKLTLGLDMIRDPGERAVYASMQANLVGGVLRTATGRPLIELFDELVAEPMQIRRYWINLMPLGEMYLGGGTRFLPRDFMKFGQLMLDGGSWGGDRIVDEAWAERATSPLVDIGKSKYGYLWWLIEYPYQGRTIRGFYAGGNGGQVVMAIPELDMVVATHGGNYNDRVTFRIQRNLVPEHVLTAVVAR